MCQLAGGGRGGVSGGGGVLELGFGNTVYKVLYRCAALIAPFFSSERV